MESECDQCDECTVDCIKNFKCVRRNPDLEQCEHCGQVFDFTKLPDENVQIYIEMHGFSYGPGERIPTGWTCPECGKHNYL